MASKRGTKERHRAQERIATAQGRYGDVSRALTSSGLQGMGQQAAGLSGELMTMLSGVMQEGGTLPYGLNAPGILEGLINRSRESSARETRVAGQEMANLMPTRGGAAARGVMDVFRRSGSEQANTETQLRTQAAMQDLPNRMSILGGVSGALPGLTQMASAPVGYQFDISNALAGLDAQLAGWDMQRAMQQNQRYHDMMGKLGGMGTQLLGAGISMIPGAQPIGLGIMGAGGMMGGGGGMGLGDMWGLSNALQGMFGGGGDGGGRMPWNIQWK